MRFFVLEDGITGIEYALMAGLIAVVIILAVQVVGLNLKDAYDMMASEVTKAMAR